MDKKLKKLIEDRKLSDADLIKLITEHAPESEEDTNDDESEEQPDSEEADSAEKAPAPKEKPKKGLSPQDLSKMVSEAVIAALAAEREKTLLPSQKPILPIKKSEPKPKSQSVGNNKITDEFGNLVF